MRRGHGLFSEFFNVAASRPAKSPRVKVDYPAGGLGVKARVTPRPVQNKVDNL
jgi:hypothetical protein